MASSDDMAMADLETGEEEEVLRRLGTAEEAGLTDNEAARRLRLHGPNVVVLSHHEGSMLKRFLTALFSLWGWDHVFPKYNNMARFGVEVLEHHACFFVALKLMFQTTYIDESNGSKCCVFKGDPAKVAHQCGCSKEVKEKISMIMDELALDGYQAIAVGHQVDSCWEFIALLPYTDDLRSDSADAIESLIDLGLDIRVLTESPLSTTKQVCGKLGKLGTNVVPAHSVFELARNNREVHSNINGISDLFPGQRTKAI